MADSEEAAAAWLKRDLHPLYVPVFGAAKPFMGPGIQTFLSRGHTYGGMVRADARASPARALMMAAGAAHWGWGAGAPSPGTTAGRVQRTPLGAHRMNDFDDTPRHPAAGSDRVHAQRSVSGPSSTLGTRLYEKCRASPKYLMLILMPIRSV